MQEHGVWVLHTGQHLSASIADEMLQELRDERDQAILNDGPL